MKKLICLATILIIVLVLSACSNNPAPLIAPPPDASPDGVGVEHVPGEDISDDSEYEPDYDYNGEYDFGFDDGFDPWADVPIFGSWTGEVVEISVEYSYPPTYTFLLQSESGSVNFIADFNTFTLGETPEVGDTITGFYLLAGMPMALIYPPQFNVSAIVNGEFDNIHVDRFDDELVSYDGNLRLNIGDETEIILQDGEPFECELAHRKLVVVYDISTRSIPAMTTPSRIIVLFEHAVTGPAFF